MLNDGVPSGGQSPAWDTSSHQDFYEYYAEQSQSAATLERFRAASETLLRVYGPLPEGRRLDVLDVGCGAGSQSRFWIQAGHAYWGVDINRPLVELAQQRAAQHGLPARFEVGSATELPFGDESVDICQMPELLEHVADWRKCLREAMRVLRPGGLVYVSTSSKLCPKQDEFNLPLYSWYPGFVKRYFERRAVTDRPGLANFATYPAVNWFSPYGLRRFFEPAGYQCFDRFDLMDARRRSPMARMILWLLRRVAPLRFLGHVMTPYTVLVARKPAASCDRAAAETKDW